MYYVLKNWLLTLPIIEYIIVFFIQGCGWVNIMMKPEKGQSEHTAVWFFYPGVGEYVLSG